MTTTLTKNPFDNVLDEVQSAPQNQKVQKLIHGIGMSAQQTAQQSGNESFRQWGSELQSITPQLVKACQQQGG